MLLKTFNLGITLHFLLSFVFNIILKVYLIFQLFMVKKSLFLCVTSQAFVIIVTKMLLNYNQL